MCILVPLFLSEMVFSFLWYLISLIWYIFFLWFPCVLPQNGFKADWGIRFTLNAWLLTIMMNLKTIYLQNNGSTKMTWLYIQMQRNYITKYIFNCCVHEHNSKILFWFYCNRSWMILPLYLDECQKQNPHLPLEKELLILVQQ